MPEHSKTVSVIIATFNRGFCMGRAIESILRQTYRNWELIIVDDGSTDDTTEVVNKYKEGDARITYSKLEKNFGASFARNVGMEEAKGDFITFLDSDDEYYPEKIEKQVKLFQSTALSNLGVVSCGRVDFKDGVEYRRILPNRKENYYISLLSKAKHIGAGTPFLMVKASIVKIDGIYFDPAIPSMEDWDFLIRICKKYNFDFVPDYLVKVNHHSGERLYNAKNAFIALKYQHNKYKQWFLENPEAYVNFVKNAAVLLAHHKSIKEGKKFVGSSLPYIKGKKRIQLMSFYHILTLFNLKYFKLFYMKYLK